MFLHNHGMSTLKYWKEIQIICTVFNIISFILSESY